MSVEAITWERSDEALGGSEKNRGRSDNILNEVEELALGESAENQSLELGPCEGLCRMLKQRGMLQWQIRVKFAVEGS